MDETNELKLLAVYEAPTIAKASWRLFGQLRDLMAPSSSNDKMLDAIGCTRDTLGQLFKPNGQEINVGLYVPDVPLATASLMTSVNESTQEIVGLNMIVTSPWEKAPEPFVRKLLAHEIGHALQRPHLHASQLERHRLTSDLYGKVTLGSGIGSTLVRLMLSTPPITLAGPGLAYGTGAYASFMMRPLLSRISEYDADRIADVLVPEVSIGEILHFCDTMRVHQDALPRYSSPSFRERLAHTFDPSRTHPLEFDREQSSRRRLGLDHTQSLDTKVAAALIRHVPDAPLLGSAKRELQRLYRGLYQE